MTGAVAGLLLLLLSALCCQHAAAQDACTECVCLPASGTVTEVNCEGKLLTNIPTNIPATTTNLVLGTNRLTLLQAHSFSSLAALEQLNLGDNDILSVEVGAFAGLAALTDLDLSGNQLTSLADNALSPLTALETLSLTGNDLTTLSATTLASVPNLTQLYAASNMLGETTPLPATLFDGVTKLERLNMQGNRLSTLAAAQFDSLPDLSVLVLSGNLFTTIPPALFHQNTKLTALSINNGQLQSVASNQFDGLSLLVSLSLGSNFITSLDAATFDAGASLNSLEIIQLDTNSLTTLDSTTFDALGVLRHVTLGNNPWNCCGLEWMRDSLAELQDAASVSCTRPELVAGELLSSTTGTVAACSQDAPDAPAPPTRLGSVPATSTSVSVTWTVTGGNAFAVDYYRLEYIETESLASGSFTEVTCPGGQIPARTDGGSMATAACKFLSEHLGSEVTPLAHTQDSLTPFTNYTFRVTAHSPLDGGTFGTASANSAPVQTEQSAPSKPAAPVFSAQSSATQLETTWTAPVPANGVIQKYVVTLSSNGSVVDTQETSALAYTFTVLPATTYSATVVAHTTAASPASDAATVQTIEAGPNSAGGPLMLAPGALARTATTLDLVWAEVPEADRNGVLTNYTVYREESPGGTKLLECFGLTRTCSVPGLSGGSLAPATTYTFFLQASTAAGDSPFSTPVPIATAESAPSTPASPTVSSPSSTTLDVSWVEPNPPNGVITMYELVYSVVGAGTTASLSFDGATTATTVTGLDPATTYQFAVRASTSQNVPSNFSSTETGTTAEAAPGSVTEINATAASSTSVVVTWAAPAVSNGVLTGYRVYQLRKHQSLQFYPESETRNTTLVNDGNATVKSFVHTGLDPATTYTYTVVAVTAAGASAKTANASATTHDAAPSRPDAVPTVVTLSPSSVQISWSRPKVPNGEIVKYGITYWPSGAQAGNPSIFTTPDVLTTVVTGLSADTLYTFSVTAFTADFQGAPSFTAQRRTDSDDFNYVQTIIIVVVVAFVALLAIGYTYEKSRRSSGVHRISPTASTAQLVEVTSGAGPRTAFGAGPRGPAVGLVGVPRAGSRSSAPADSSGSSDEDDAPAPRTKRNLPPVRTSLGGSGSGGPAGMSPRKLQPIPRRLPVPAQTAGNGGGSDSNDEAV